MPRKQRNRSTRAEWVERQEVAELGIDGVQATHRLVDGADIGAVGVLERG
jgi:hypothetical protein